MIQRARVPMQPEAGLGGSYAVALEKYGIGAERLAGVLGVVRSFSGATATGMARVARCSFCNSIAHTQTDTTKGQGFGPVAPP